MVVCLAAAVLVVGVRESANVKVVVVVIKVATALIFIALAVGVLWKNPQVAATNWHPFIPENTGRFGDFGWSGVALLGVVISLGLMATLPWDTWPRLLAWLLLGFVIYFSYSRHHSRAANAAQEST
ncbi:MAG: amino acid permease C-terminal domain-containing protein [Blastocatellia bacterium]|nr:amino acid permease C-terminal domain-containing protein [Blastocatellia bacterium]